MPVSRLELFEVSKAQGEGRCSPRVAVQITAPAPDGRRSNVISCNGFMNSFSSCLVKAARDRGPHGYDTLKDSSEEDRTVFIVRKLPEAR